MSNAGNGDPWDAGYEAGFADGQMASSARIAELEKWVKSLTGRATAEDAAKWVDARRDAFVLQHGYIDPDTGTLEFGRGSHAEEKTEYVGELEEIAEGLRSLSLCQSEESEKLNATIIEAMKQDPKCPQ